MAELKKTIDGISEETWDKIKRKSAMYLPSSPTASGFNAADIRKMLYQLVTDTSSSTLSEIARIISEANEILCHLDNVGVDNTGKISELREMLVRIGLENVEYIGTDSKGGNVYRLYYADRQTTFTAPKGDTGNPFTISKTYSSVEELEAAYDSDDVPLYGFALVDTGNVEDEDNAKLYFKGDSGYSFLTDLSGAQGIRGERGYTGAKVISVDLTGTDGNGGNVYLITFDDGTTATFTAPMGQVDLDTVYPVGSIYMSVNSTSPASFIGGSWSRIQDKFLLASGSSYSAGSTGGEATHTLTVAELPRHTHVQQVSPNGFGWAQPQLSYHDSQTSTGVKLEGDTTKAEWSNTTQTETAITGSSTAHNNMPPYLAVYVWKRTA